MLSMKQFERSIVNPVQFSFVASVSQFKNNLFLNVFLPVFFYFNMCKCPSSTVSAFKIQTNSKQILGSAVCWKSVKMKLLMACILNTAVHIHNAIHTGNRERELQKCLQNRQRKKDLILNLQLRREACSHAQLVR